MIIRKIFDYFTLIEKLLWTSSVLIITLAFFIFDRVNYLTFFASLIGVTSLIFNAKGNPFGQVIMIAFSVFYGIISYEFQYYGEMITYLGMSAPMALFALISWLKHPYKGNKAQVTVSKLTVKDFIVMIIFTVIVTIAFYFILGAFNTANLIPSTLSVTTSFLAVFLMFKRSQYFALGYIANDVVLIVLWILAMRVSTSNLSVVICFFAFLLNDTYSFINWNRMYKIQNKSEKIKE